MHYDLQKIDGKLLSIGGHTDPTFENSSFSVNDVFNGPYPNEYSLNDSSQIFKVKAIINTTAVINRDDKLYIQPNRAYTDEVVVSVANLKLELGNKATDWTPAPEDQEQYVNDKIAASEKTTEDSYKALIDQTAKEINLLVQKAQSTADSNSSSIATISTNLNVTAEGLSATKTAINTLIDAVNGTISKEEMQKYIRWNGDNLELGNSVQPFKCKLSNTELAFYQNEDKVAWISNKELNVLRAIIAESIGCGAFRFIDEGDLGFSLI